MSKRNRNRWVPPSSIESPERGAEPIETPEDEAPLAIRDEEGEEVESAAESPPPAAPAPAISERERRLLAAAALEPDKAHWADIWKAGRDAAVTALRGGAELADVYALPPPDGAGCRDCWMRGRDAVIRGIQGV